MAAAELAREGWKLRWSLNTMSVSSSRDRSGGLDGRELIFAVSSGGTQVSVDGAIRVRVSGLGIPAGDTQPLVAALVPGPPGARALGAAVPSRAAV